MGELYVVKTTIGTYQKEYSNSQSVKGPYK